MANNPLASLGIDAEPPQEAEYDAVYAAVTATERGRWFLTEFANRNRHADTDSLVAALARLEAAVGAAARSNKFIPAPDLAAAAEKIQDVAFGLRERGADPALCDALETAVRDLGALSGNGAKDREDIGSATLPETGEATLAENFQPAAGDRPGDPAAEVSKSPECDFEFEFQDKEKFAAAATALAASLSSLGGQSMEEAQTAVAVEQPPTATVIPPHDYAPVAAPEPQPGPVANAARWYIEPPDFAFHPAARPTNGDTAASSNNSGELQPLRPRLRRLANPEDDPAELLEPAPAPAVEPNSAALRATGPAPAPPASAPPATAAKIAASPGLAEPPPRVAPRPVPISPLAALRALSEDELLALFG